jgi:hypothetical protein
VEFGKRWVGDGFDGGGRVHLLIVGLRLVGALLVEFALVGDHVFSLLDK